jgi:hypothetical protein
MRKRKAAECSATTDDVERTRSRYLCRPWRGGFRADENLRKPKCLFCESFNGVTPLGERESLRVMNRQALYVI